MHDTHTRFTPTRPFHRRHLLQLASGAAGAALLAACGAAATPTAPPAPTARPTVAPTTAPAAVAPTTAPATMAAPTVAASAATTAPALAAMPTAAPATVAPMAMSAAVPAVPADGRIPSTNPDVPDAYTKLPPPFKSVSMPPGKGGKVTTFQLETGKPVPPRAQNVYWQELEKRLGVTLDVNFVPQASYNEKFATLVAGGDLPDLLYLTPPPGTGRLVQQGAFADLTSELTGDGLKQYPNLALYPPASWRSVTVRGKVFGVPRPSFVPGNVLIFRQDWAEKVGGMPKNADDFLRVLTAFTKNDPDGNGKPDSFGLTNAATPGATNTVVSFFNWMYRGANNWKRNGDGSLVKDFETEEYKQSVAYARKLWEAGAFHPDSATMTVQQAKDAFIASKVGGYFDNITALPGVSNTRLGGLRQFTPDAKPIVLTPFGADGGAATYSNSAAAQGFTVIPAKVGRDHERVKELLRVVNYLASPFGSEEYRFLQFGLPEIHHTIQADGEPLKTDQGEAEKGSLPLVASSPRYPYYPDIPGMAQVMQKSITDLVAIGIPDPTIGLYSATNEMKAAELTQLTTDRLVAVITGREPLTAWDGFVKDWRSRGGDAIRKELEAELKG